ncbi:MAG: rhomboid family intramembrane serine protease [Clostridiales bacterium]|nr:rhomboid family intramembrane serine protease [Clostridiales bacterium]
MPVDEDPVATPAAHRRVPWVTGTLVVLLVAIWILLELNGGSTNLQVLIRAGAQENVLIRAGQWWRLITPIFLHFGLLHLAFNALALWFAGSAVETMFGHLRFLAIFFLAGIGGSLTELLFDPRPHLITVGASGAIFGLLGALVYLATLPFGRGEFRRSVLLAIALGLAYGFVPGSDINNYVHAGGLVTGLAVAATLGVPGYPGQETRRGLGLILVTLLVWLVISRLD